MCVPTVARSYPFSQQGLAESETISNVRYIQYSQVLLARCLLPTPHLHLFACKHRVDKLDIAFMRCTPRQSNPATCLATYTFIYESHVGFLSSFHLMLEGLLINHSIRDGMQHRDTAFQAGGRIFSNRYRQ